MNILKKIVSICALTLLLSTNAWSGIATTGTGYVIFAENGWSGEGFAVHLTDAAAIGGCASGATEFGLDANHPAYKILVALMITAYAQQTPVQLVVDQGSCVLGNRTRIVSIRMVL